LWTTQDLDLLDVEHVEQCSLVVAEVEAVKGNGYRWIEGRRDVSGGNSADGDGRCIESGNHADLHVRSEAAQIAQVL